MGLAVSASAINPPVGELELRDGATYMFQNVHKRSSWLGHTSWDGALYYNNASAESHVLLTAVKNDDGTWSFTEYVDEETVKYLVVPAGTGNLNTKLLAECPNSEVAPRFVVTNKGGLFRFVLGEGNNDLAQGYNIHMNSGNEYVVASYDGDSWYPDIYGGTLKDEDGNDVFDNESRYIMADSTTCDWNLVLEENTSDYMGQAEGYAIISQFETDYILNENILEEDKAGFKLTYDAAAAIYEDPDYFYELDNPTISEMISAKVNLYALIQKCIAENVDDDAVLAAAIDKAYIIFNGNTEPASLTSAYETLENALKQYKEGSGDLTALIVNNSFEDLSSQDGQQTTGVQGAPTGWNVYINGNQVVTAAEVKGAGIANWHGINNDAEGELDGNYAFGIWTSGVPTYEVSQTISGLENGTYLVQASLMAGANGSGSRMTTQRIFANLNSTYFGQEEDYDQDQLDKSEVYEFQGNDQTYVTDRYLFPMEVKAYVYDGTLTLGVRTDGNVKATWRTTTNSAGGDGWFKVDNFRMQYNGYVAEDAYNIFQHFAQSLDELYQNTESMSAELKETLEEKIGEYRDITEDSPQETINPAILEARELISEVSANAKAYQQLSDAIAQAWVDLETYQDYPGAPEYGDVISEIEGYYYDGEYTTEGCADAIQALAEALQTCIESNVVEPGKDVTNWIKNPSFEDLTSQNGSVSDGVAAPPKGWNIIINGDACTTQAEMASHTSGWCAINHGDNITEEDEEGNTWYNQYTDGECLWGLWSGSVPQIEIYQELNLPAGTYELKADIVVQNDWAGFNLATQRLFAGDYVAMYGDEDRYLLYLPEDAIYAGKLDEWAPDADLKHLNYAGNYKDTSYGYSSIPYTTSLVFGTEGTEPVRIGFRSDRTDLATGELSTQASMGWFKLDNFRLTCINLEVPTAIQSVENEKAQVSEINYNLAGQQVNGSYKGIVIKNGKKTLVK